MTTVAPLTPEVVDRLKILQNENRPVSVEEILNAANLNHLTSPSSIEKSVSTSTLAERRRIPINPEKLKFSSFKSSQTTVQDNEILKRLEQENAKLPTQDSEEFMLARLERQNALLNADPKSVCIESNRLQADFSTIRNLVNDATFSPTQENYEASIQAMLAKAPLKENTCNTEDEWDFWQQVVKDYSDTVQKFPHLLAAKLRYGGIPHPIRGVVWQSMSQSSSLNLEALYTRLSEEGESSSYDRVIQRDLSRTFPQLDMFKDDGGEGQLAMGRLLRAYSLYDAHVGYCQGLAFLVGPLLMTMPEKEAFCVFVRLMETYDMRTMFTLNMEGLHLRLHQFGLLLSQLCPNLDAHFNKHGIHTAMYASQWYLTLFAYSFPISLVLRIYDLVFAEGAVETITRVAVAIMQKNQDTLIAIDDFEQLMLYLSSRKLYEVAFQSDPEQVIADTMALSSVITKQKMDSISDTYHNEIEQEKTRAQQVLAIRFGKKSKRDSWFPWSTSPTSETAPMDQQQPQQDRTIPMLHEQIEDLVTALSHLQKENTRMSEELMARQMKELDWKVERQRLAADQPSPVESVDGDRVEQLQEKLQVLHQQPEFCNFVDSLKLSGDFGSLIAGALSGKPDTDKQREPAMDDVTSELVSIKLANFEMGQKYQHLCQEHEQAVKKLNDFTEGQSALVEKIMTLQTTIESLQIDKEQLLQERDSLLEENEELSQKAMTTKKTCGDLQLEKITLENENQKLQAQVKSLEDQRREYLMPRGSFTEEVFAAHQSLFGKPEAPPMNRRHTVSLFTASEEEEEGDSYQKKFIESDLRCRELEKLLAETKFKLVEYEAASDPVSPRGSLQQNRRSMVHSKRSSLSMLVKVNSNTSGGGGPLSPSLMDTTTTRESIDSVRSNTSSSSHPPKRSSVYSRFLNALGTGPLPEETQDES